MEDWGDEYWRYTEIFVKNISESDMAVKFSDGDTRFWVPKSVMGSWPKEGETGDATIKTWFAWKEGLI